MGKIIKIQEGERRELDISEHAGEIEIYQRAHSALTLAYMNSPNCNTEIPLFIRIFLEQGASLDSLFLYIGGGPFRIAVETHLHGEESAMRERTVYLGKDDEIFDMTSNAILEAPGAKAEIISKGILAGRSRGRFLGNIHIQKTARRSEARLNEHTLLLSPEAKINAVPGLKIDTNDVIASHSAGITRVDADQLFYAESRGVPEETAVRMIAEGFLLNALSGSMMEDKMKKLIRETICEL